jgi:uncharacterized protein (TIGR03083 family)
MSVFARQYVAAMTDDELFAAATRQRQLLCDQLEPLSDAQWNEPSLCAGWQVRDVLGHLVSILELSLPAFLWRCVMGGGFSRGNTKVAHEFGHREPKVLIDTYRRLSAKRFSPPFAGPIAPLTDVMIHSRDIGRVVGLSAVQEPESMRAVLDLMSGSRTFGFVARGVVDGLQFSATDIDWSSGTGAEVLGPAEVIMMTLAGRVSALGDLSGEGTSILRQRLST